MPPVSLGTRQTLLAFGHFTLLELPWSSELFQLLPTVYNKACV